jgi:hypothetical protein
MDNKQEMKVQVSSLASWIDVNQEEMKAMLDACLEKMEANPGELQSVTVHQEVPKEEDFYFSIIDIKMPKIQCMSMSTYN